MTDQIITLKEYRERYNAAYRGEIPSTSEQEHELYYAQFVTPETLRYVESSFGAEHLMKMLAKDEHFNSIPLKRWDAITSIPVSKSGCSHTCEDHGPAPVLRPTTGNRGSGFRSILPFNREAIAAAGEIVTMSTLTCIAKRAARMIVERANAPLATAV